MASVLGEVIETGPEEGAHDELAERILEGALRHFEEFGLRRTTMEDVARRVGVSRVTIYRRFAGKEALIEAAILREVGRFFGELDRAVGRAGTADEALAEGFAFALEELRRHPLVTRLLTTEPEALLPHLTLEGAPTMTAARRFVAERLAPRGMPSADVEVAAELLTRLVLSFLLTPETAAPLETADDARRFARRYLAPAMRSVAEAT